ncbi:selenium cofactor biosynthesis protein YqeC [Halorubrum sp. DTA98]|uniref:selenium cofactor biosynthesis protein YqeC n=1 Tax=Halorubrum sp. DTA98 TaxID=3402163 RepID=UPI003AAD2460
MDLVEAFRAEDASVAVVGAGGKKTTMYALAERTERAVVTATVRIPIFDDEVARVETTADPVTTVRDAADDAFPLGVVPEREREDRYRGYDVEVVDDLIDAHDGPVLIKADGARLREFKAPNGTEPRIPDGVDVVVPVVSAGVVGEPLTDELVHRPERVVRTAREAGVDAAIGQPISPETVGAVIASPDGGLKDVPAGATAIPLVNKVDDDERERAARDVAEAIRAELGDRPDFGPGPIDVPQVVLGRMLDAAIVGTVRC